MEKQVQIKKKKTWVHTYALPLPEKNIPTRKMKTLPH